MQGKSPPPIVSKKTVKTFKFEEDTRNLLSVMNMHLRAMDNVSCANETQMVNDRAIERELAKLGNPAARQAAFAKIKQKSLAERDGGRREIMSLVTADSKSVTSDLSLSQGTTTTNSTKDSGSTNIFSGKGKAAASSVAKSLLSKKSNSPKDDIQDQSLEGLTKEIINVEDLNNDNEKIAQKGIMDGETSAGKEIINVEAFTAHIAKKNGTKEIINVEELQAKNSVEKPLPNQEKQKKESHEEVTWKNLKLRSVDDLSKEKSKNGSQPEWASVALKKVKQDDETVEAIDLTDQASQSTAQPNSSENESTKGASIIHLEDMESVNSRQTTSESIKDLCKKDQAIAFKLRSESPGGKKQKVLLGKSFVMLVAALSDETAADILWKIPRDVAKALAFDMSIQQVKLSWEESGDHKVLRFSKGNDCLQFVSLLSHVKTEPGSSISESSEDVDDDFASVRMERVNDEEKSLLQKFRSLPKDAQEALQDSISSEDLKDKDKFLKTFGKKINDHIKREAPPQLSVAALFKQRQQKSPPEMISAPSMPTSPVSTFSVSVALPEEEQEKAKKYQKMLKFGVPSSGVLDKMKKDGVEDRIIQYVLGDESSTTSGPGLTSEEETAAAKYKKMLSAGIPSDAVNHCMTKDGVDQKIMDHVLGVKPKSEDSKASQSSAPPLSEDEEKVASKYRKMLKFGLETSAVEHGMKKDQVDPKIMSAVLGTAVEAKRNDGESNVGSRQKKTSDLTKEEEASVKEYKRLLKLQIPKDQLEGRMRHEGASEKVIAAVLGKTFGGASSSSDQSVTSRGSSKLVSLHWTPLSGDQLNNSVFSKALDAPSDASELLELFQKKPAAVNQRRNTTDAKGSASSKARLVDLNRSNNVAISLKAYKDLSQDQLADIIRYLDPEKKLDNEKIAFLKDLLPSQNEIKAVKEYYGPDDRLVPAELWFRKISTIKRIDTKVKVMRTIEMLEIECRSAEDGYNLYSKVCNEVQTSEKLHCLIHYILHVGNTMNEGTRTGGIAGYKFDTLLKLTQTKSTTANLTLLDGIIDMFIKEGKRDTLDLRSDIPECRTASRMSLADINAEVSQMQTDLELCQKELASLKADLSGRKVGKPKFSRPGGSAASGPPAFLSSIQSLGNNRSALLNKIAERKIEDDEDKKSEIISIESKVETPESRKLRSAIDRLDAFVQKAAPMLAHVETLKKEAQAASREMSRYCGEGCNAGMTPTLLVTLSQFCDNLEEGLKKYDSRAAREARKKAKEQKDDDKSVTAPASDKPVAKVNGIQHVINVHSMLHSAPEQLKNDFKKGRKVYNPSEKMKEIYEAEQIIDLATSDDVIMEESAKESNDQPEVIVLDDMSLQTESMPPTSSASTVPDTKSDDETEESTKAEESTTSNEKPADSDEDDSKEENSDTSESESTELDHIGTEEAQEAPEQSDASETEKGSSDNVTPTTDEEKKIDDKDTNKEDTETMFDLSGSTRRLSAVSKPDETTTCSADNQDSESGKVGTPSKSTPTRNIPSLAKRRRPSPSLAHSPLRSQSKPPSLPQTPAGESKGTPVKTPVKTPVSVFSPKTPLISSSPGKKESLSQLALNKRRSRRSPATTSPLVQEVEEATDLKEVAKVLSPPQINHPYDEKKENSESREPKPSSLANLSPFEKRAMAQRERRRSRQSTE